ncbi:SIMPL domain-containing protein [Phreatobacter sp.]|uniref:SIMPL domain-containing protein n=1 Tax=Phreatobacter sp. TaxID=1966341 RepID=UPI003F719046
MTTSSLSALLPRRRRLLAVAVAGLTVAGLAMAAAPAAAQERHPARSVTMQGEGNASAAPDHAVVVGGTQAQARTAREAMDANTRAMRQVQEALTQAGIAERDVVTSGLSLTPQLEYGQAGSRPRVTGYAASHRLQVRVRDLARLGDVLDRMVQAGANRIDGITLAVTDWSAKVDEARIAAVADARRKAELLAQAAGARLGKVITVEEHGGSAPPPMLQRSNAAMSASAGPVPIAAGDQTFRLSVTVRWELVD